MLVRALQLANVRNLAASTIIPSPRFNVIAGENGHGKTNVLEAIYLAGTLRSFRTQRTTELIAWGETAAQVSARVVRGELERVYEVEIRPRSRTARLDGKTPRSLGEYFGDFNVVLFAPEDLRVPRGSPAGRRRFLDRSVFNREVTFLTDAQRFARVLKSRNVLLRSEAPALDLLDVYDAQLVATGNRVLSARRRTLAAIEPRFAAAYEAITQTGLIASLQYESSLPDEQSFAPALMEMRRRDIARRQTHIGPHVDDLIFLLDGREARAFASQGQLRALILAWKTAEMSLLRELHGDAPVLLLDDVSSELDPKRNAYLFEFLARIECQCFVTTTHSKHVLVEQNRQDFQVVDGTLQRH